MLIASGVTTVVALLVRGGLNLARRLEVSDAGISVHRVTDFNLYRWWDINRVSSAPDMSQIVISANGAPSSSITLSPLPEDRRVAVVNAIRARLRPDRELQPWRKARWGRQALGVILQTAGSILLFGSISIGVRAGAQAQALGVRCSGPSAYLSQRFDVPRQPGCVFVRVSGPAARAGIDEGDQMIALDETPVTSGPQFNDLFNEHKGSTFVLLRLQVRAIRAA
jgi:hypothetical protein